MKKLFIIVVLAILGVALTFFLTIDFWTAKKMSEVSFSANSGNQQKDLVEATREETKEEAETDKSEIDATPRNANPKRTFKPAMKIVNEFPFEEGAVYKWISRQGKIYVQDPYTQQILELDDSGKFIKAYGSKGGAPWEHEGIMSFEVSNGNLYTADNSKMVIKRGVLGDKNLDYHQKIKETFWDAALLRDDVHIVLMEDQNDHVGDFSFRIYNARENQFSGKTSFRELLKLDESAQYLNIAYGGHFIRSESGHLLFVCSKAGKFLSFDENGKVEYVNETIDNSPPPKVTMKKTGKFTMYVKEPDLNINYSATADETTLYILSCIRFIKAKNLVVDQYRISDGEYIGSVEIPNNEETLPHDILITPEGKLWVLYESMNVVIYQLDS